MPPATASSAALPRVSLAFTSALHAAVLVWAAHALPWRDGTLFSLATAALATLHAGNAILALAGAGALRRVWRALSWCSLAYLVWLTWGATEAAVSIAALYGQLGRGVAAAIAAAGSCVVLFTLPFSCWGLARTGGVAWPGRAAGLVSGLLLTGLLWRSAAQARATPALFPGPEAEVALAAALAPGDGRSEEIGSLQHPDPVRCDRPPTADLATAFVTWRAISPHGTVTRSRCLQSDPDSLPNRVGIVLSGEPARGPVKLDWVTGVAPLVDRGTLLDALALRPGLDGVCLRGTCFAPWQLVAADRFTTYTPLPFVRDLRFGFSPAPLREVLGGDGDRRGLDGLVRVETRSLLLTGGNDGIRTLRRLREPAPTLDAESLRRARDRAERHVTSALLESGRFRYRLQPFSGARDEHGFELARQAGTTRVLCELGQDGDRTRDVARRSLEMMARLERQRGGRAALLPSASMTRAGLGSVALPLLALLGCRDLVGGGHDALIGRLADTLLALQRPDGGFHRGWDLQRSAPLEGPEPLFAVGQAVFALSELEAWAADREAAGGSPLPASSRLRVATDRAMQHTATRYWDHALAGFFFLEENWHCLAARASLDHHRHDAYERFCLDYVAFKSRLVLDEASGVDTDFVGGYGFGNVLPPHNTSTAGFAEALAAATAIKQARGLDTEEDRRRLRLVLRFLLRQQWTPTSCFACAPGREALGGFSESMTSPVIRIDYVQHAWAALGHGGRVVLGTDAGRSSR